MGKLIRALSADGLVRALALDAGDIAERARRIHGTTPVCTAALGRALAAASLMGALLDEDGVSVTLQIKGGGPIGTLVAVADAGGDVRGYAGNPSVELPLRDDGKLDVGGAVGADGYINVIRDTGSGEPYAGSVPLASGEIAEDVTAYFAVSEQVPTVCALGVLVGRDRAVRAAGGYLIQLMPGAGEDVAAAIEAAVAGAPPVSTQLDAGLTPEGVVRALLPELDMRVVGEGEPGYVCRCSRERVERALISLGADELEQLAVKGENIDVDCHFCDKKYAFTPEELFKLRVASDEK